VADSMTQLPSCQPSSWAGRYEIVHVRFFRNVPLRCSAVRKPSPVGALGGIPFTLTA